MNIAITSKADEAPAALRQVLPLWLWTLGVSFLATWTCYRALAGVNWTILTTAATAGLALMARSSGPQQPGACVAAALILAVLLAGAVTVTADRYSIELVITALAVLGVYAVLAIVQPPDGLRPAALAIAPISLVVMTVLSAGGRVREFAGAARSPGALPVLRGPVLALALGVPLFLLLAAAEPALGYFRDLVAADLTSNDWLGCITFFTVVATLVLGTYGLAAGSTRDALPPRTSAPSSAPAPGHPWRVRDSERLMVLSTAAALYGVFFAAGLLARLGLAAPPLPAGVTLAEATHRGFIEMLIAAGLCALVIITLDSLALRGTRELRVRLAAWAVIAGSLLAVIAAHERVLYYEAAYGYTRLRLYVHACCAIVALALLLLAAELRAPINLSRLIRHVASVMVLAAGGLAYWNVTGWIVQANVERYQHTGQIDGAYLSDLALSPDAVPSLIASLPHLPTDARELVRGALVSTGLSAPDAAWYEWNLRRSAAEAALRTSGFAPGWSPDTGSAAIPGPR